MVTVVLFAMDVDLLESSSQQSLFRHGFATCVCGVRDCCQIFQLLGAMPCAKGERCETKGFFFVQLDRYGAMFWIVDVPIFDIWIQGKMVRKVARKVFDMSRKVP